MTESRDGKIEGKLTYSLYTGEIGIGATIDVKALPRFSMEALFHQFSNEPEGSIKEEIKTNMVSRSKEYFKKIDLGNYKTGSYWERLEQQPKITAVISGKGGVGKTGIALGLTEYYSMLDKVLLVDFDLHNRSLTSMYGPFDTETTLLSEMKRFSQIILTDTRLPRDPSGNLILNDINEELFVELREQYCIKDAPRKMLWPLNMELLYRLSVREASNPPNNKARPSNCYFLPSRRGTDDFLGTTESMLDAAEIAIFLTYLASLAQRNNINRIVLDCHGAQDLFMVGAMLASVNLVIVAKAEPSSFEGTMELVWYAQKLVESQNSLSSNRVLVFNEYRKKDEEVANNLYDLIYKNGILRERPTAEETFDNVPKIEYDDSLRDLFKLYHKPSILNNKFIGPEIQRIGDKTKINKT